MYCEQKFPADYNISPRQDLINAPLYVQPENIDHLPAPGRPLTGEAFERFVTRTAAEIAARLDLKKYPAPK
jgi:threonine synthase